MPKLTRDTQFQSGFKTFMDSFCETYYPELKEWSITNTTENKTTSTHTYCLTIPNKVVLYELDRTVDSKPDTEVVMADQDLPTRDVFERVFKSHYDSYLLEKHGSVVSYTSLTDWSMDTTTADLSAAIEVCYYKSYLPYPSDQQSREQLVEQCKQLRYTNETLKYDLDQTFHAFQLKSRKLYNTRKLLKRQESEANDRLCNTIYRMQEKVRELYYRLGEEAQEECPVCYEVMHANEIVVPGCCHYICARCNESCDKCPLCREEYVVQP